MRLFKLTPLVAALATAVLPAHAATFTVTNTDDAGPGSLREALGLAAGNCPGSPRIEFAIPGTGPFVIAPASPYPSFFCAAPGFSPTIDGSSQTGWLANTSAGGFNGSVPIILDGSAVPAGSGGCAFKANVTGVTNMTVNALHIRNFADGGACGLNVTATGNIFEGNGSNAAAVYLNGQGNSGYAVVGGAGDAQRNWFFGNTRSAVLVSYGGAATVRNNLIGTDASGEAASPNGSDGIHLSDHGPSTLDGNIIAGNNGNGIWIGYADVPVTVTNNKIGRTFSGAALGNSAAGVRVTNANQVNISQNYIAFNGGRGINLDFDGGPLENDYQDEDTGPNNRQNYPDNLVIDHVSGQTPVTFTFNSKPGRTYRIEFFSNATPGVNDGRTPVGSTTVTTDANGDATATSTTLAGTLDNISATARDETTLETSEFSLSVAFTGVPAVNVAPSTLNFGNVGTGTTSAPRTTTLTSSGTGFWIIGGIGRSSSEPTCYGGPICYGGTEFSCSTTCTVGSGGSTDLLRGKAAAAPGGYAPGASCKFTAQFSPTRLGPQTEKVGFCDNTAARVQEITLTGTGVVPPALSLLPSTQDFGDVTVGTISPLASFAIRNSGVLPVPVVAYRTSGPFVFEATSCGNPIQPGESCQAQVTFRPTAAGAAEGFFVIETASGAFPSSRLGGNGSVTPRLALPVSIEFTYTLGSEPTLFQLPIVNSGLSDLQVNAISISGSPFTLANPCPAALAPRASCVLTVGYSTLSTGQFTGTLTVSTNAPGGSRAITLNGLTQLKPVPVLDVTPSQMGYGTRTLGVASPDQSVTIRNIGAATARIESLVASADFVILRHDCTTLAPLESCDADIAMLASAYGQRRGTLTITSNAERSPHSVSLSGTSCRPSGVLLGRLGITSGCMP